VALDRDSVVIVTGGARGIGARVAIGLARTYGCGIELIGRSPLPSDYEAADLAGCDDAVAVRQAIIRRGELRRPGEIEAACTRVLAEREIRRSIAEIEEYAAFVGYRPVDVRDLPALAEAVADVRQRRGRLDGVVHAAGVREDKLIRDKTIDSFARVFDTKVQSARLLADAVSGGGFLVLFASVAGTFGNVGQVDYAAANSALDVVARRGAGRARLLAVDWGPWAGAGMVTPELAREYARRGIGLIEPDDGVDALLAELAAGLPDPQVVVMRAEPHDMAAGRNGDDAGDGVVPTDPGRASGEAAGVGRR
jgi:NAD(P)-dependent dehydrogenase (short-subunit alcohol dehydrogenase family)